MFLSDLHTHTWLSLDGRESVDSMCAAAVAAGLGAIAITDHWDGYPPGMSDPGYKPHFMDSRTFWRQNGERLLPEIEAARLKYPELKILYGVELGQPDADPRECSEFLAAHDFDFILASRHLNGEYRDYYALDYSGIDIDSLLEECFQLEIDVVHSGVCDVLAHIDQPVRLLKGLSYDLSLRRFRDGIAELLREMIKYNVALELNTDGLRKWYGRISPPDWVLPLYRDLGGELVSIGSDAHYARDVGAGVSEARALADAFGLRTVSYFEGHEPVIIA